MADEIDPKYEPSPTLQSWIELLNELLLRIPSLINDWNAEEQKKLFELRNALHNWSIGHRVKDVPEIVPAKPAGHNIKDLAAQFFRDMISYIINRMVEGGKTLNGASVEIYKKLEPLKDEVENMYGVKIGSPTTIQGWSFGYKNINKKTRDKYLIDRIKTINDLEMENSGKTAEELIDGIVSNLEER